MKQRDTINAAIGSRIRKLRIKKNMTQEVFAEKINICTGQQISNIERGLCGLSISKFMEICRVLDTDADYLLFGISAHAAASQISEYLEKMTPQQAEYLLEIVKIYAKSCGTDE